ncbi:MAG: hypothetical protein HYZ31_04125 [Gammaproteobacteria bacterium]|nr:hypothetical protein [Gammaproteobacteria bacterium]
MSEFIKINGFPPEYAKKAFDDGYYLEALQTLHGWIECKLRELLLLQRTLLGASFDSWSKAWDISNEFSLNNASKALLVLGAITEEEQKDISTFNRVRNNLVHKMFYDPYNEHWQGVDKQELVNAFEKGLHLADFIDSKSCAINEKNNPL